MAQAAATPSELRIVHVTIDLKPAPRSICPLPGAVLQRFGQVPWLDGVSPCEIGHTCAPPVQHS